MHATPADPAQAFRSLERHLLRRRVLAIERLLRVELAILALLVGGFVFWQTRIPLDGAVRAEGLPGAARFLATRLAVLALFGAGVAGGRHAWTLAGHVPGPEWLALPVPPARILAHLRWNSLAHALWVVVPALAVLVAGAGLVPLSWLLLGTAAFVWVLIEASRLACAIAYAVARFRVPRRDHHPIVELLARVRVRAALARVPAARWTSAPAWAVLLRKDLLLSRRPGEPRRRVRTALLVAPLVCVPWLLPGEPRLLHFLSFALALIVSGLAGEWLLALANSDPFLAVRGLPVAASTIWCARTAWAALASVVLVALELPALRVLRLEAFAVLALWLFLATFGVGLLAVNYGLTLHPHGDQARRLFLLSVGLSIAASLMIPLLGWVVLFTAVIHSLRRVPRWARPEIV